MRCCRCFALPLHILAFAWAQRSGPWSKPLWDSTPCFPGSPWRSSPTTRCSSYVQSAISELAAAEISPSAWILSFTPTELFLVFCALGKCRERYSGRVCAESCANLSETAPPWQWIDFSGFFPSPTSASIKLRKQCVTCGSLLPATCFIRPVLKVAYLAPDVPAHFRTLNFFFLLLFVHSQEVDGDFKDLYIFIYLKNKNSFSGVLKACKDLFVKSDGRAGSSVAPLSPLSHLSLHGDHRCKACWQR